jgi:hypothetical protein
VGICCHRINPRIYFIASVESQSHLWRQRFPNGQAQQITFGPTEEDGLAVDTDGHTVITAMGVHESALWIHDEKGERPVSSEGEIVSDLTPPTFTADGQSLYYLTLHQATDPGPELWRLSVATGSNEPILPGIHMTAYDVSADSKPHYLFYCGARWKLPVMDRAHRPQCATQADRHGEREATAFWS